MGCPSTCIKCLINTFNTFWAIFSVLVIAGVALSYGEEPLLPLCIALFIGVLGLVASIVGCCGTCNENVKVTQAYAILIGISLLIQIIALILMSVTNVAHDAAIEEVNEYWEQEVAKKTGANTTTGMDYPQIEYKCCGKSDPSDYYTILRREPPVSCYPHQFVNQSALYTTGCTEKVTDHYDNFMKNYLGGSWSSIVFTIIILLLAIYLIIRFRRKQTSRRYNYNECPMK